MSTETINKPPVWFYVVSSIALLWNAMGVNQYLQQAFDTESFKAYNTPEQLEIYANLPGWYAGAFAVAVFGGAIGCILLLLRKKLAFTVFLISLIAIIFQMGYLTFSLKMANIMTALIIVVGIFLVWLSKKAIAKGWIA